MKGTSEQDRQGDGARAGRRRIVEGVARVVGLLVACFWLLVSVAAVRTGYLSRIGVAIGVLFVAPLIVAPMLGWAGRRRLEGLSYGVHFGIIALIILAVAKTYLWPQESGAWRAYRFDDALAALEAGRAVTEADNAAHRYDALFAEADINDQPDYLFSGDSLRDEFGKQPWKGGDYPQASTWLDSHAGTIDKLLVIGKMERCRWPVQADAYDEYTVPYEGLRYSVRLLTAAGNRDLGEGRVNGALTRYFCVLRIADHLHQQPSTVNLLTGLDVEKNILQMIRCALVQSDLSGEDIAEIASHLPTATDPWPQEWATLLEYEKLRYLNLLGRLYEVNDKGEVRFTANPAISPKERAGRKDARYTSRFPRIYWLANMPRDPQAVRDIVARHFAGFEHVANPQRLPQMDRDERTRRDRTGDTVRAACNVYRWWAEAAFFNESQYFDYRRHHTECITLRRGTWLVLGLRRYRDTHGTWPETLDKITNHVPPEAFADPSAGAAFVYAPDGDSLKLYSKGPNRVDDGGRSGYVRARGKSEDDIRLWPPPVQKPEQMDGDEMRKQMAEIYGREYVEEFFKDDGSDKQ